MVESVDSTSFYAELERRSKKSERAKQYIGVLVGVTSDCASFLEYVRESFPAFTDHSYRHSIRIIRQLGLVCEPKLIKDMSSTELFLFILIALFHDTGMVKTDDDELLSEDEIRERHHMRSGAVFEKYFTDKLRLLNNEKNQIIDTVKYAMASHGREWDDLKNELFFKNGKTIFDENVSIKLLCVLLRVGDLLDFNKDRTNEFVVKHKMRLLMSTKSLDHHVKYDEISDKQINGNVIRVYIKAKSARTHLLWEQWLGWLTREIYVANTHIEIEGHGRLKFPQPDFKIERHDDANYIHWPLRFELDEDSALWNIVSKSIYTNKFDFIRELIQNAIDASLIPIFNSEVSLSKSPRGWDVTGRNISVFYSNKFHTAIISDTGVGMSYDDLKNFLFKVSKSGFSEIAQSKGDFPRIAQFGIGFISLLTRAKSIHILTKKSGHTGIKASIESKGSMVFAEESNTSSEGTQISLDLAYDFTFEELRKYMESIFVNTSIPIKLYNADDEKLKSVLSDKVESIKNGISLIELNKIGSYQLFGYERFSKSFTESAYAIVLNAKHRITNFAIEENIINAFYKKSGILFIPCHFIDYENGIEWESIHALLVENGRVVNELDFVEKTFHDEIEFDDVGSRLSRLSRFDNYGDDYGEDYHLGENDDEDELDKFQIRIVGNKLEVGGAAVGSFDGTEFFEYFLNIMPMVGLEEDVDEVESKSFQNSIEGELFGLEKELRKFNSIFTQDGIRIDFDHDSIAPIGASRSKINLTTVSRMRLNVTRNSIDENPEVQKKWVNEYASIIHSRVICQIKSLLDKADINYDLTRIIKMNEDEGRDSFYNLIIGNIHQIINDMK